MGGLSPGSRPLACKDGSRYFSHLFMFSKASAPRSKIPSADRPSSWREIGNNSLRGAALSNVRIGRMNDEEKQVSAGKRRW